MPNTTAYLVLFSWPFVVLWMLVRFPSKQAIFIATTLSVLLLPSHFDVDLPFLPPLNRETITSLSLACFLLLLGRKFRIFQPGLVVKFIIGYLAVLVISAELNSAPIIIGSKFLPGLTHYDAFADVLRRLLWLMPFFLGRYFFSDLKDTQAVFKVLVVMALIYSLLMLLELRISPQLHRMVYGYHSGDFIQNIRGDGYRPTVFVGHGLPLAFWVSSCVIAAMALHKTKVRIGKFSPLLVVGYLLVILVLTKTWSAVIYAVLGLVLIYTLSPSKQIKWAFVLSAVIMLYPVTKITGLLPDKDIISSIKEYNVERGESIQTRLANEEVLLAHALKKPFFGWGGWGRNRLYDNNGNDSVITDGKWIMELGTIGSIGFFFYYAILLTPLFYASRTVRYITESKDQVYFACLALILTTCIIDSIPNSNMSPMHLLLAGVLLGQSELIRKQKNLLRNEKIQQNR